MPSQTYLKNNDQKTDLEFFKYLSSSPANIAIQFEVPRLKKMIKVTVNARSTIKQHLNLFSSKFDSDFVTFKIQAYVKLQGDKKPIQIDKPIRYIVAAMGRDYNPNQQIVVQLVLRYDGG